jgi:hypothetical protein
VDEREREVKRQVGDLAGGSLSTDDVAALDRSPEDRPRRALRSHERMFSPNGARA